MARSSAERRPTASEPASLGAPPPPMPLGGCCAHGCASCCLCAAAGGAGRRPTTVCSSVSAPTTTAAEDGSPPALAAVRRITVYRKLGGMVESDLDAAAAAAAGNGSSGAVADRLGTSSRSETPIAPNAAVSRSAAEAPGPPGGPADRIESPAFAYSCATLPLLDECGEGCASPRAPRVRPSSRVNKPPPNTPPAPF